MISKYAITEIITTGLNFKVDRIIHISTYIIEDQEIRTQLSTYINPERTLEPEYIRTTGILNDNFKFSPKFYEKAKTLINLWDGCTLLSSSSRYTLTFLKNEFKSLGFDFNKTCLPYSDHVTINIPEIDKIENKAYLLACHFLDNGKVQSKKKDFPPRAFLEKEIKLLPNECGIYILKNNNGNIIYVGKAIKIRTRLRQHFRNMTSKGFKMHKMVSAIDFKITKSELFALLLEQYYILHHRPELNKALRNNNYKYDLRYDGDEKVLLFTPIERTTNGQSIKRFKSKKSAFSFLLQLAHEHVISLDKIRFFRYSKQRLLDEIRVFDIDIIHDTNEDIHNLVKSINPFYNGRYIIKERGYTNSLAVIENGVFIGLSFGDNNEGDINKIKEKLEYKYQSEYALNQIVRYFHSQLLTITNH